MNTFGDRLKFAIRFNLLTPMTYKEFAEKTSIPYSTLQNYLGNKRLPNFEALEKIAKFGVNIHWLVTGEGDLNKNTDMIDDNTLTKLFWVCFDDILKKCLSNNVYIFSEIEKDNIIKYLSTSNPKRDRKTIIEFFAADRKYLADTSDDEFFDAIKAEISSQSS